MGISLGGVLWLAGVAVLEAVYDPSTDDLPAVFSLLAVLSGCALGWGCWRAARAVDTPGGRIGMRSVALCSLALGLGLGLSLIEDMFLGFLVSYVVGLFLLPVAFLALGLGVLRSRVFPGWAKWIPWGVASVAIVTYGLHAFAPGVWDPSDAVWFLALGFGWVGLGLAVSSFNVAELGV